MSAMEKGPIDWSSLPLESDFLERIFCRQRWLNGDSRMSLAEADKRLPAMPVLDIIGVWLYTLPVLEVEGAVE